MTTTLQGLPNIGVKLAKQLLAEFKTIQAVFNATPEQLMAITGIGKKKAELITKVLTEIYMGK